MCFRLPKDRIVDNINSFALYGTTTPQDRSISPHHCFYGDISSCVTASVDRTKSYCLPFYCFHDYEYCETCCFSIAAFKDSSISCNTYGFCSVFCRFRRTSIQSSACTACRHEYFCQEFLPCAARCLALYQPIRKHRVNISIFPQP